MPPHSPENPAPQQGPQHAATPAAPALISALTGGTGGFPHLGTLEGETSLGRHRRPESLADATTLRAPATDRMAGGRRPALELTPRSATGATHPRIPQQRSTSQRSARGRHAATDQLAITVRPLPSMRDAAGAVRDWARADTGKRPATGAHRAPGTLPIESWLLIGRKRQQALLAGLVAVGLMLAVVPMRQDSDTTVTAVNAAENAVAKPPASAAKKPGKDAQPATPTKPKSPQGASAPAPANPSNGQQPAPAAPAPPAATTAPGGTAVEANAIPKGDGPARSLRTTGTKTVALTFDDGPDPVQTPRILALLKEHEVTAMFCLVGDQVRKHPEIVRDIAAAGHALCNHSWNHSLTLGRDTPEQIRKDLVRTNDAIRAAVPDAKIPYFRAPGGNFTKRLVETAYAEGMTSLYWEVDPRDWEHDPQETNESHVEKIVNGVADNVRPGSIVLSHDFGQPATIEAYETLLPWLREKFTLGLPPEPTPAQPATTTPATTGQ
ncbi:polysaccharide deacetylase family protein [Actinoplanes sp. NPDC051346]|uniref:polysaccharide deacetylase family protein n=1 Tax=Actinoplanes sp. NPDC051346 TaxID=3155048 RepID=UPI003432DA34